MGSVCVRAAVRVRVCFPSREWMDRLFPRESSFTSLRKKERWVGEGQGGGGDDGTGGGGWGVERICLTLTHPPSPLASSERRRSKIRVQ